MAWDFPDAPVANDIYTAPTGAKYIYTGVVWDRSSSGAAVSTVPEAPADGQAYNRRGDTQVWVLDEDALKVDLTGDTMTGALTLPGPPALINEAATKGYVDAAIASGSLYQGLWQVAANTPDLTPATMNPQNGWSWIAQTANPAVPETAPVGLPGIGGMTIFNGDNIKWNTGLAVYERTQGSSLTAAEATSLFVDVSGDTMTGPLLLASDPVAALGAAPKQYVDLIANGRVAKAGDTMTGPLIQAADPVAALGTATKQYVDAVAGNYVHLTGDTMVGPLDLPLNPGPVSPTSATTKQYVDETIAANALYQGTWQVAANIPDLTAVTPLNGYSWLAQTVDPSIPELTTITLPGIPLGTSIDAGWTIRYNGGTTQFELIKGPDISLTTAQTMFVDVTGDTMTGPLLMAADPTAPLEVATKQYVDANAGLDRVAKAGDTMTGNLIFNGTNLGINFPGGSRIYDWTDKPLTFIEGTNGSQPQIRDNNAANARDILDAAGNQAIAGTDSFLSLITRNGGPNNASRVQIALGYNNQAGGTYAHEIRTQHDGGTDANNQIQFWLHKSTDAAGVTPPTNNPFNISGTQLICNQSLFIAPAANITFSTQQAANPGDNSKHIQLYSTVPLIGINVTSGRINYNHNAVGDMHVFRTGNADRFTITGSGGDGKVMTVGYTGGYCIGDTNHSINTNGNNIMQFLEWGGAWDFRKSNGNTRVVYIDPNANMTLQYSNSNNNENGSALNFATQDGRLSAQWLSNKNAMTGGTNEGKITLNTGNGGWGWTTSWYTIVASGGAQVYFNNSISVAGLTNRSSREIKKDIRYVEPGDIAKAFERLKLVRYHQKDPPPPVDENGVLLPDPAPLEEERTRERIGLIVEDLAADPELGKMVFGKGENAGYDVGQMLALAMAQIKVLTAEVRALKEDRHAVR